ncbi:MAG: sporulation inhibitor of replication protein SirA [Bacilli bacterium]|nr:sporulation inhibitor of replication protein SirA [Bacilli bacterium]MBR3049804.1 sporulation inhibitor of replication protein SirA [Bacilli bacterium]
MRVYFIFSIKLEFINLYYNNKNILYSILKQIYYLDSNELKYGYNIFNQLINDIDKNDLDKFLYVKLHRNIPYSKRNHTHIYNNLYKDEVSKLIVKRSYIKLETENNYSSFFKYLKEYNSSLFVCDFKNQNYFFIKDYNY